MCSFTSLSCINFQSVGQDGIRGFTPFLSSSSVFQYVEGVPSSLGFRLGAVTFPFKIFSVL